MTIADYRAAVTATTGRILPGDTPWLIRPRHRRRAVGPQGPGIASASQPISDASRSPLLLALIVASTVGMVASSIYVPSIPQIARNFDTSISAVQLTFVGYLAAFAVSLLVLGPLSDRYGRQPVMLVGLGLCLLSSLACACSPSIEFLIAARIAQGIGACAGMAVGRAAIRDVYGRDGAAPVLATLAFIVTLVQAFAPVLGGQLQEWVGWRSNFIFVALLAACALALAAKYVPETRSPGPGVSDLGSMLGGYWSLLRIRTSWRWH
jgi:DHA1 family bicyclomycin/chloramphenicol resistance-like MFS transporter